MYAVLLALLVGTALAQMETTTPVEMNGGAWQKQNPNDPEYMGLLWKAVPIINSQLGRLTGAALVPASIDFVQTQIVVGMNYSLKVHMADSNCKIGSKLSPKNGCVPLPGAARQIYYITIYDFPEDNIFDVMATPGI